MVDKFRGRLCGSGGSVTVITIKATRQQVKLFYDITAFPTSDPDATESDTTPPTTPGGDTDAPDIFTPPPTTPDKDTDATEADTSPSATPDDQEISAHYERDHR